MWEGVGDRTELQHIDPHSSGHNSVSFPFSWAWGPASLGAGFLYRILSPTDRTSCAPSYKIVQHPPSSCGRHKSHSFNPFTVKVIFWYFSTGCTCYLHRWTYILTARPGWRSIYNTWKGYYAFSKAPSSLEPHNQIVQCHIQNTHWVSLTLCRDARAVFSSSSRLSRLIFYDNI